MSVVGSILTSAIVVTTPAADANLETLLQEGQFIRGFIADGTGCGTLGDPIVTDDTVTFILTDYIVEKDGRGFDRATCDLAVEVDLPIGTTISLDSVTYRGFADGFDARSTFYREYFFAGEFIGDRRFTVVQYDADGEPTTIRDDSNDYVSDFGEFTAQDETVSVGQSSCGELVVWRANTALSLRNRKPSSISMASIDTVDVENKFFITFIFGVHPCDP